MITDLYQRVFNEEGDIKLCGREECQNLIQALSEKYPGIDFGNKDTGFMCVPNIKEYKEKQAVD